MAGMDVSEAYCLKSGFKYDREWMLLDTNNQMITQRENPKLALFKPNIVDDVLQIEYHKNFIKIPLDYFQKSDEIETKIWEDIAVTQQVSEESNEWFSRMLEQEVKFVKIKTGSRKHLNAKTKQPIEVSLADGYPYLFLGTKSIELLSKNHGADVAHNRFRANVIYETNLPHEEDNLQNFKIGNLDFINIKPCVRCSMVTIDQQTAEADKSINKTLATYRKFENKVFFGTNAIVNKEGVIKVGDKIVID
jgi:uncharacterized protein YcbX